MVTEVQFFSFRFYHVYYRIYKLSREFQICYCYVSNYNFEWDCRYSYCQFCVYLRMDAMAVDSDEEVDYSKMDQVYH